jgi:hypothetical protein
MRPVAMTSVPQTRTLAPPRFQCDGSFSSVDRSPPIFGSADLNFRLECIGVGRGITGVAYIADSSVATMDLGRVAVKRKMPLLYRLEAG